MSDTTFLKRWAIVVLTILFVLGFWYLRGIWVFGFAAAVVATGVTLPARWLQRHHVPRTLAVLIAVVVLGLSAILLVLWIVPPVIQELVQVLHQLPQTARRSLNAYATLRQGNGVAGSVLPPLDFASLDQLEQMLGLQRATTTTFLGRVLTSGFSTISMGLGFFSSLLLNLLLFIFLVAFFLADPMSYIKATLFLTPVHYQKRLLQIWDELYQTLTTWIWAQCLSVTVTVCLVWLILGLWLHVPHSSVVAVFAGVATFIPNIGAFLPLLPVIIFTLAANPALMVWAIPAYLFVQLLESNIITPLIVKSELKIPSGLMMLFQLTTVVLFGALGLLLAVPMCAVAVTLVREIYSYDMLGLRDKKFDIAVTHVDQPMALRRRLKARLRKTSA
ncbi:MAG: AI-2E family transporter [Caldilineaceae bacterium]